MRNILGIFREGLSKRGEKRVAVTPYYAKIITEWGHKIIVQPARNPKTNEIKRAFADKEYSKAGIEISEDLSKVNIIFGLKEIDVQRIMPEKVYYLFSHTHKGQLKNREMLYELVQKKCTVIDYELIKDEKHHRLITAFTYNAGYAGMVDSLWTLGKRLNILGVKNPFESIPQSIEVEDLEKIKAIIKRAGKVIEKYGTPENLPPVITAFLGKGKTSHGAQEIYDLLPVEEIPLDHLAETFYTGSRKKIYKILLRKSDIYRLKSGEGINIDQYKKMSVKDRERHYMIYPEYYESNLDQILPNITLLMNCIMWAPQFPRSLSNALIKETFAKSKTLIAIGDITCDPNGSIEFSRETWIDNPVFVFNPLSETIRDGFEGDGIAVMAVTNLPCEFSSDASRQFSEDIFPYLKGIVEGNYNGSFDESGLPPEIKRAVILWKGEFTDDYMYMRSYLSK